ncbi:tetratricopeptide repeat protein [Coleofasciculus sp. FACHB-T130]|uniref:tetratricopeptide repeat protein n=1 Tax=Cyanophyceae TaxID=3028117 RepID=UPI001685FFB5|nr:tetratricopeptide repeat protein [Coleofasciculus sp. FACHB-T130]MBD1878159.1 tetratricopeptide repeat protein [Coleofasciculus sp. FACHB-T130]
MRPSLDYWQGRTEERQKIGGWMADGNIRLIGITGLGGFGKSTLAAKIYEEDRAEFDKKFWVDVSRRVTFSELARRVLLRLGLSSSTVEAIPELSLVDALVNHLREGRYLLVIDNLESLLQQNGQWLDAIYEQFFHGWLGCGGKSVILVTTRERPDLPEIKLQWLPLPGLLPAEGANLLGALGILGTETELLDFAKKAEGHPLLLTLVAGFLRAEEESDPQISHLQRYGLADVAQLVTDEKLKGLHRGNIDIWMRLVLDASFNRLSDKLQRLLLNLSVYRIPFNTAAADAQLPGENVSEQDLRQLARCSLLQEERDKNGGRWFQFHPFILVYVKQKAGDLTEAHQKAIAYYKENAKSEPWQTKSDVAEYLEVFYHCYQLGEYDDAFKTIRLCDYFLTLRGYNTDLVELYGKLVETWQQNNSDRRKFAASLTSLGNAYRSLGQYQKAIDYHQQSLAITQEIGNPDGEATSLNNLGIAYDALGQYQKAIDYHQQSLAITREIGDRNGEVNSLGNLGNAYRSLGEYQKAIDYYQQSLAIKRAIGDRNGEATSLIGLGIAYDSLGQYQKVIDYYEQSLAIFREIGDRNGEAASLGNLGIASNSLGQYPLAIDYHKQSLAIKREIGARNGEANSLISLGMAYDSLGQYPQAIDYYQQSLAINREIGDRKGEATSLINLGMAYDSLGQYPPAIDYYEQSLAIFQEIGARNGEAASLFNLGITLAKLGRKSEAIAAYQNAHDLYQTMGLDANVQNAENAIQSLSRKTNIWMSLPKAIVGFLLRWVYRLWRLLHTFLRQR